MCGLLAIVDTPASGRKAVTHAHRGEHLIDLVRHRGPDQRGTLAFPHAWLGHRRLAIVSPETGEQPCVSGAAGSRTAWVTNSEIFNHLDLRPLCDELPESQSDSAVIGPICRKFGMDSIAMFDGQFSLVVVHEDSADWIAARDHIGICPLFVGFHADGTMWFASEMKCLIDDCERVEIVEPGTAWVRDDAGVRLVRWYDRAWMHEVPTMPAELRALRDIVIAAVEKRIMGDVPWGVLLSGGLDSSLVASIAQRASLRAGHGPIHTFSIGLDGAPDLEHARTVAKFIGSHHHEFRFTVEEAVEALPLVVEHLESDQQIRTGVPTFLLAKKVKQAGFKMVLSGEGADEILAGYLYFHKAPSPAELHIETVRKTQRLHRYDVMRADKAPMAHGLELRFPLLDRAFIDHAMSIDPADRMPKPRVAGGRPVEKWLLRAAFDEPSDPWLPDSALWRQKEQFSDGVGYAWVDTIRAIAERRLPAGALEHAAERFPEATPTNAEMYWMRELFEARFVTGRTAGRSPLATVGFGPSVACSTPEALAWDPSWLKHAGDISGRAIADVHEAKADLGAPPAAGHKAG
jgi:asparagine synthase (glutamine-hydrolysing)